jgi:hypothetical protein
MSRCRKYQRPSVFYNLAMRAVYTEINGLRMEHVTRKVGLDGKVYHANKKWSWADRHGVSEEEKKVLWDKRCEEASKVAQEEMKLETFDWLEKMLQEVIDSDEDRLQGRKWFPDEADEEFKKLEQEEQTRE